MITSVVTWLTTHCKAALPDGAVVEIGAEYEKRAPVVPSIQVQLGKEAFNFDGTIVGREATAAEVTLRRKLYDRSLPVRIIIYRRTLGEVDESLQIIVKACPAGLTDADGSRIRVTPISAPWARRTSIAAQSESCSLELMFEGGVHVDTTAARITGVVPEPDDQEG